jgi:aryl-alcohol dehydrogenase-like predicted oxidoreductase
MEASAANGLTAYSVLQTWYNLLDRPKYEGALDETAQAHGLGVLAFYGLANGYLTGSTETNRISAKAFGATAWPNICAGMGPRVLAALDRIALETGSTPAQIALAWISAKPGVTAPIASATSAAQLEELLGCMELELTPDQIERLDAASTEE